MLEHILVFRVRKRGKPGTFLTPFSPLTMPSQSRRFHGEQTGLTEDVFMSATLKLSAVCLGGIDAQLSEVSSDWEESDEEEIGEATATGEKKEPQREPLR